MVSWGTRSCSSERSVTRPRVRERASPTHTFNLSGEIPAAPLSRTTSIVASAAARTGHGAPTPANHTEERDDARIPGDEHVNPVEGTEIPHSHTRHKLRAVLGLLALLVGACDAGPEDRSRPDPGSETAPRTNLVVISLDTTRRDHLSLYEYQRPTSPFLESLSGEGATFLDAVAQQTNTLPSQASVFTGRYPHEHGALLNQSRLPAAELTLAEILAGQGYRTGAFVSGFPLRGSSGIAQGFDVYDDRFDEPLREDRDGPHVRRDGDRTVRAARQWLATPPRDAPFFLFVHLYDAHGPADPPPAFAERFATPELGPRLPFVPEYQRMWRNGELVTHLRPYVDRYDAAVAWLDELVERLLEEVELSNTVVVVMADHGETLGHPVWPLDHGARVTEDQLRVPLLIVGADVPVRQIEETVELIDLFPTVLELVDVDLPARSYSGRSLASELVEGDPSPIEAGPRTVFASARSEPRRYGALGEKVDRQGFVHAARRGRWKLVFFPSFRGAAIVELYDLERDPRETENLVRERPEIREELIGALRRWGGTRSRRPDTTLEPEARERLRALGYVD